MMLSSECCYDGFRSNRFNCDPVRINLAGVGIGDGWMSPFHNARYANFLYWSSLLDAKQRDECLAMEMETQRLIDEGQL